MKVPPTIIMSLNFYYQFFISEKMESDTKLESDLHSCYGSNWKIHFYPLGTKEHQGKAMVMLQHTGHPTDVKCHLVMKEVERKRAIELSGSYDNETKLCYTFRRACKGTILVTVVIEYLWQIAKTLQPCSDVGQDCAYDVTLDVQNECFRVNSGILTKHSSVFKSMLELAPPGMFEFTIDEEFHPRVVFAFLSFLCGESCASDNFGEVFRLADKFRATQPIVAHLLLQISVKNCLSMLELADRYHCKELKDSAMDFVLDQLPNVVDQHRGKLSEVLGGPLLEEVLVILVSQFRASEPK